MIHPFIFKFCIETKVTYHKINILKCMIHLVCLKSISHDLYKNIFIATKENLMPITKSLPVLPSLHEIINLLLVCHL